MSRIGKMSIALPQGVDVKCENSLITVKGPKGTLTKAFHPDMIITVADGVLTVARPDDEKQHRSLHGLTRTLISNMVEGVTKGYSKELDVNGVGYRVAKQGKQLVMNLGYSHQVFVDEIDGITIEAPTPNKIVSILPRSFAARKARPAVRNN